MTVEWFVRCARIYHDTGYFIPVSPEQLADLIILIDAGVISHSAAKQVWSIMYRQATEEFGMAVSAILREETK